MPHYNYGDEDNRPDFVEPCQDAGTVIWADEKLSQKGDEQISVLFKLDNTGATVFDQLTFSPKAAWRVDTFLKATGHAPAKGDEVEITKESIIGWRAFLDIGLEDIPPEKDKDHKKKRNTVIKYITNKGVPEPLPF